MYNFPANGSFDPSSMSMMSYMAANSSRGAASIAQYRNASINRGDRLHDKIPPAGLANNSVVIRPCDVLCGRGKVSFNHSGNRRFRHIVSQAIDEYKAASSKWEKSLVAAKLVNMIHNSGGRFLKQRKNNEDEWYELSSSECKSKVSHAIRDAIAATKQTRRPSQQDLSEVEAKATSQPSDSMSVADDDEMEAPTKKKSPFRGTWSSNSLVSLTGGDDKEQEKSKAQPDKAPSKMNESWSSSYTEDESSSSCDGGYEDDFVVYIHQILGPNHK